MTYFVTFVSS